MNILDYQPPDRGPRPLPLAVRILNGCAAAFFTLLAGMFIVSGFADGIESGSWEYFAFGWIFVPLAYSMWRVAWPSHRPA